MPRRGRVPAREQQHPASLAVRSARFSNALFRLGFRVRSRLLAYEDRRFASALGVNTLDIIDVADLSINPDERATAHGHTASSKRLLAAMLAAVPAPLQTLTFVDVGSGKGHALLVAAGYPFRRVIGVELAEELHQSAQANIRVLPASARSCGTVELRCEDAAAFQVPSEPCVLYFNNPFAEPVMARVLENVLASRNGRTDLPAFLLFQQLRREPEQDRTEIIAMLDRLPYLEGGRLTPRRLIDRFLLASHDLRIYSVSVATSAPAG
jgi:hypothetical protein